MDIRSLKKKKKGYLLFAMWLSENVIDSQTLLFT